MTTRLRGVLVASLTVLLVPTIASAQNKNDDALMRRVEQLERRTADLERRVRELESPSTTEQPRAQPTAGTGNARDIANWRRLRRGMTMDQVRALLGEPETVNVGLDVTWHYVRYAWLTFDAKSERVTGWSEPSL